MEIVVRRVRQAGFTLIELLVVIAIMAGVIALATPRLLPALLYSTHEGAARHLATYGEAAIAQAAFDKEKLTFKFDFKTQEYWLERTPTPPDTNDEEEAKRNTSKTDETKDKNNLPKDDAELERMAQEELNRKLPQDGKRSKDGNKVLDEQARRMMLASSKRAESTLTSQAERVKQDEKALPRSQRDLYKKKPTDKENPEPIEVKDPLLGRTRLPDEVKCVLAGLGEKEFSKDIFTVEIPATGLDVEVKFWLENQSGKAFVVTWDPATGSTRYEMESTNEPAR